MNGNDMKKKVIIISASLLALLITISTFYASNQISQKQETMNKLWVEVKKYESLELKDDDLKEKLDNKYEAIQLYNEAVKEYNIAVRKFPNNIYAKVRNLNPVQYYVAKSKN